MKTLNDYMKMPYRMEIVRIRMKADMWFLIRIFPAALLVAKQWKVRQLMRWMLKKHGLKRHWKKVWRFYEPDSLEDYSEQFKLKIPRSLHRSLAEHSQKEGISMNQYCVYLLSKNDALYSK